MGVSVECACGKRLKAKDEAAGRTAKCPSCGNPVRFPDLTPPIEDPFANPMWERTPEPEPATPEPPPLPKDEWHYSQEGQRQGPVPLQVVQQLAASGQLKPTDMAWKVGMTEWALVASIPELIKAEPPKPIRTGSRSKKALLYGLGLFAVVALVAGTIVYGPWEDDPVYAGKPLSAWGVQLKDGDEGRQKEAIDALAANGVSSYRYMPSILGIAQNAKDPEVAVAAVTTLLTIANSAFMDRSKVTPRVASRAKAMLADMSPKVAEFEKLAEEQKKEYSSMWARDNNSSQSLSTDYLLEVNRLNRKWSGVAEKCFGLAETMKTLSDAI